MWILLKLRINGSSRNTEGSAYTQTWYAGL